MDWRTTLVLMVCLFGPSHPLEVRQACPANSNEGREFYLAVPLVLFQGSSKTATLYFASQREGNVQVEYPAQSMNQAVHLNKGQTELDITPFIPTPNMKSDAGIFLQADTDISVSMFVKSNYDSYMAEYLALPTSALSTNYTVPSGKPFDTDYGSEIIVVAAQDSTTVSLLFPGHISGTSGTTFTLNRLDTYYYFANADMSGAQVKSDKPVAVISATEAARVPSAGSGFAESIAEYLLPDDFAGYNFIVPHLPGRKNFTVKVLPVEPNTDITIYNASRSLQRRLQLDDVVEFTFGEEGVAITSNKPVLVYQYALSSESDVDGNGALMRNIPAIENYVTEANFVAQGKEAGIDNIVQVILPVNETVEIDGGDITMVHDISLKTYQVNGEYYDVHSFVASPGYHVIKGGIVEFGALLHGYKAGDRAGYGHALGVRRPECYVMPSPTPSWQTTPTPAAVYNVTTSATTTSGPVSGDGPLCLSCDDVTHFYLCDVFERCTSSQSCYVEQYKNYAHQTRFRMGCKETSECVHRRRRDEPVVDLTPHIDKRVSLCVECCHGNFCNTQGCSGEGLPPRYQRGPLCLSCSHVLNPAECNTLAFCQQEEVCYVEESSLFGDLKRYSYGCETQKCTASTRGKILCEQCCKDDFCNHACNSTGLPGIFG